MRLTTKGRYAVTAMLDLALHGSAGPVSLADISGRQQISLSYLEQLFSKLRKNELVRSIRGPGGGYQLNKETTAIHVTDIINAVNEQVDATSCGGEHNCQDGVSCLTHHLWSDLNNEIHTFLDNISLASLMKRREVQSVSKRQDKHAIDGDNLIQASAD